jgi:hypothetical protein
MGTRYASTIRSSPTPLSHFFFHLLISLSLSIGSEWKDDWGLSVISSTPAGSARHSLNIRGRREESEGDSNITRPLSVVRGTFSDPFREAMNSINELERGSESEMKNDTKQQQERHNQFTSKPNVSFESIYPDEDGDEDYTFSHTQHPKTSFRSTNPIKQREKEKTAGATGAGGHGSKEKLRFQAL